MALGGRNQEEGVENNNNTNKKTNDVGQLFSYFTYHFLFIQEKTVF